MTDLLLGVQMIYLQVVPRPAIDARAVLGEPIVVTLGPPQAAVLTLFVRISIGHGGVREIRTPAWIVHNPESIR